jgi:L-threonylcarbamoyladenylate synthase
MSYYTKKIDEKIVELLKRGAVGLLPTDTIYGLSAVALNEKAVSKVHRIKNHDNRPFIVLISDIEQLAELGLRTSDADLIKSYWPGALSVIFESNTIPSWLQMGTNSLAVRLPDNNEVRNLIKKVGPIVSTSANLHDKEPACSVEEAGKYFGDQLDFYVDAGKLKGQSSTLVKIENGKLKILRQGAYEIKP